MSHLAFSLDLGTINKDPKNHRLHSGFYGVTRESMGEC